MAVRRFRWFEGEAGERLVTEYVGATLATQWRSEQVMSDIWENILFARVWDAEAGQVTEVSAGGTYWGAKGAGAEVDATPEVVAAANRWEFGRARAAAKARYEAAVAEAVRLAKAVEVGKEVEVVRGRKVPKGTVGVVIWVGEGRYYGPVPRYRGGWNTTGPARVGLKTADGTVYWTAASNVEVSQPDEWLVLPVEPTEDEYDAMAAKTARFYSEVEERAA